MEAQRVAVFVDMENVPAAFLEQIADLADTFGRVCHLAVYADWRQGGNRAAWGTTLDLGGVPKPIMKAGGPNSADIAITVDAVEVLLSAAGAAQGRARGVPEGAGGGPDGSAREGRAGGARRDGEGGPEEGPVRLTPSRMRRGAARRMLGDGGLPGESDEIVVEGNLDQPRSPVFLRFRSVGLVTRQARAGPSSTEVIRVRRTGSYRLGGRMAEASPSIVAGSANGYASMTSSVVRNARTTFTRRLKDGSRPTIASRVSRG
jgi:hypothetical protein